MSERRRRILPKRWSKLATAATIVWVLFVWFEIQGDYSHPLAQLMFLVPLGGWIAMIAIAKVFGMEEEVEEKPKKKRDA